LDSVKSHLPRAQTTGRGSSHHPPQHPGTGHPPHRWRTPCCHRRGRRGPGAVARSAAQGTAPPTESARHPPCGAPHLAGRADLDL